MSTALTGTDQLAGADRIWHLRQAQLMDGLSTSDLNSIAAVCRDRIYSQGEIIFKPGDEADSLFLLNRGSVRISLLNANDREKILGVLGTGDVFGEEMLEAEGHHRTQAVAHQECWVSIISREQFLRLIEQRMSIALSYMKILTARLARTREDVQAHSFLDIEHRLVRTLLRLAEEHGKPLHSDRRRLKLKISLSHELLARLIGGNRPHVSMIMSRFRKRGWISYQGRKLLIDVDEMRRRLREVDESQAAA